MDFKFGRPRSLKHDTDTDFTLILASFSYLGKTKTSHFHHSFKLFMYTYIYQAYFDTFKIFVQNKLFKLYICFSEEAF